MTEQERLGMFKTEFEILTKKYGVSLGINLVPRPLGPVIQVEAVTDFVLIPGWQPSEDPPSPDPAFVKSLNGHRD